MKRISIIALVLIMFTFSGCGPEKPLVTSKKITTLDDFLSSEFGQKYQCKEDKSWSLKTGGTAHSFKTNLDLDTSSHDVLVEITTNGTLVTGLGLTFYNDNNGDLTSDEIEVIYCLVRSLNQSGNHTPALSFIYQNIEKPVHQIYKAPSIKDGQFRIWAGKVLQQTISIERIV